MLGSRVRSACVVVLSAACWLAGTMSASGETIVVWGSGFADGGRVPDGTFTGGSDTRILSGPPFDPIANVAASILVDGGWNGDYYAFLTHGSGFRVLPNSVGRTDGDGCGCSDVGPNGTLDGNAADRDVPPHQTVGGGSCSYQPNGRTVNPMAVQEVDARTISRSRFSGLDPNGEWTLLVADLSSTERGTVLAWAMPLTSVQKLATLLLAVFGLGIMAVQPRRWNS